MDCRVAAAGEPGVVRIGCATPAARPARPVRPGQVGLRLKTGEKIDGWRSIVAPELQAEPVDLAPDGAGRGPGPKVLGPPPS